MATSVRIKRRDASSAAGAPSSLLNGELAYNENDNTLYYGFGVSGSGSASSSIKSIAGEGSYFNRNESIQAHKILAGPGSGLAASPTYRLLVSADIPDLAHTKITDFDAGVQANTIDTLAAAAGNVDLNSHKIVGLADPVDATDAANKQYVDAARSGLDVKASVRAATTANITLSNTQTVDAVALAAGDRVLVKDQTDSSENGIYDVVSGGSWTRSSDADTDSEVTPGLFTFVEDGTASSNKGFVLTNTGSISVGTDDLLFAQFSDTGIITAGSGLSQTGQVFNVGAGTGISVNATTVRISSSYSGQNTITTVGTIASGTWQGSTLGVGYGGTGLSSVAKGSVIVSNTSNQLTALDGGGSTDGLLSYDHSNDTISWSNTIDGGTF
jgi:hypothetical protein